MKTSKILGNLVMYTACVGWVYLLTYQCWEKPRRFLWDIPQQHIHKKVTIITAYANPSGVAGVTESGERWAVYFPFQYVKVFTDAKEGQSYLKYYTNSGLLTFREKYGAEVHINEKDLIK
jgi:hypothetical protein